MADDAVQCPRKSRAAAPARGVDGDGYTRREMMIGSGHIATAAAAAPTVLSLLGCASPDPEPWADDTWWDDDTGWIA